VPNPAILKHIEELKALPDEEVIALTYPRLPHDEAAAVDNEMTRRQLVASRNLAEAMRAAKKSADRASKVIITLTAVVAVLTGVLVWLTIVLVQRAH